MNRLDDSVLDLRNFLRHSGLYSQTIDMCKPQQIRREDAQHTGGDRERRKEYEPFIWLVHQVHERWKGTNEAVAETKETFSGVRHGDSPTCFSAQKLLFCNVLQTLKAVCYEKECNPVQDVYAKTEAGKWRVIIRLSYGFTTESWICNLAQSYSAIKIDPRRDEWL